MEFIFGRRRARGRRETDETLEQIPENNSGKKGGKEEEMGGNVDGITGDAFRRLAFKSGFVSLQERLNNLNKSNTNTNDEKRSTTGGGAAAAAGEGGQSNSEDRQSGQQFATLHEFFQSKSSLRQQREQEDQYHRQRRPKIPVMKLSKDDWNVKIWEERLNSQRRRQAKKENDKTMEAKRADKDKDSGECPNRPKRLDCQVEVFNGRIDDVAMKLEKVREGLPLDEQLFKLSTNRLYETKSSHTWTDLLKEELAKDAHNSKLLKSRYAKKGSEPNQLKELIGEGGRLFNRRVVADSPLGRPIRRLSETTDEEEEEA